MFAGRSAIHRTTSTSEYPRSRASVHTADRPTCSDEIPPQAGPKSPSSSRLSSEVQGEWSETMQSMSPRPSARHSSSRLSASRIGGQHLNWVAPSAMASASKTR